MTITGPPAGPEKVVTPMLQGFRWIHTAAGRLCLRIDAEDADVLARPL